MNRNVAHESRSMRVRLSTILSLRQNHKIHNLIAKSLLALMHHLLNQMTFNDESIKNAIETRINCQICIKQIKMKKKNTCKDFLQIFPKF